ncbi:hypothetical protein [Veronia nyctiphanis]|uniref:hypothetical protein n=1 Tax=Veronia nyctiphanis TaxID=1278244 RepID=UPI001375DD6B|nr:hypothetical protein [Veronia nyctiphanis]
MTKSKKPIVEFTVRLPIQTEQWLRNRAKENMRSRHKELLFLLEKTRLNEAKL